MKAKRQISAKPVIKAGKRAEKSLPPPPPNDAPLIDWANWCADIGHITGSWKVFPCVPGEKRPLHNGWKDEATCDPKTVKAMWRNDPDANIGLAIQPGFVAIDADIYKPDARDELDAFEKEHGLLPLTFTSRTARGGYHLIYSATKTLGNGTGTLPNFGDVRGHGGLIVGPGSKFKGSQYTVKNLSFPSALPEHIEDMLRVQNRRDKREPDDPVPGVTVDDPRNVEFFADWCAGKPVRTIATPNGEVAKPCIEGQGGNNTLAATGAMAHDFGLSADVGYETALEHHNLRCEPPWDDDQYERHFRSGYQSASSPLGCRAPKRSCSHLFKPIIVVKDGERVHEKYRYGEHVQYFEDLLAASGGRDHLATRFGDILPRSERHGASWVIENWLLKNGVNALFGESETFKTYITINMLLSVATGSSFCAYEGFEGYHVDGPRDVILFAGEGYDDVLDRIDAAIEGNGFDRKLIEKHLIVVSDVYTLNRADGLAGMADEIETLDSQPAIIAVDTYNLALEGNEDGSEEAKRALRGLRALAIMYDAAGLVLHHPGWADKKRPRGSSAFRANSDVMILCERVSGSTTMASLTQYKNRSADKSKYRVALVGKPVDLGNNPDTGAANTNLSFAPVNPNSVASERNDPDALKIGTANVYAEALAEGLLAAPPHKNIVGASEATKFARQWMEDQGDQIVPAASTYRKWLYRVRDATKGEHAFIAAYLIHGNEPLKFSHPDRVAGIERHPRVPLNRIFCEQKEGSKK